MHALLIPQITLVAKSPNDPTKLLTTTPQAATIAFVTGEFADPQKATASTSTTPITADAVSSIAKKASVFILPGVSLGIFPVGFILTASWATVFVGAVGYGTFGRLRFRDSYRRRMQIRQVKGKNTI